jgi:hypothetical protein
LKPAYILLLIITNASASMLFLFIHFEFFSQFARFRQSVRLLIDL